MTTAAAQTQSTAVEIGQEAPDFELNRISLLAGEEVTMQSHSVGIFLVLQGKVQVEEQTSFSRRVGDAFIAFDKAKFSLRAVEDSIIYRASVPQAAK